MKLDTTQTLKTLSGDVMMDNDGKGNAVEATVRMAVVNAVLAPVERESGVEKVKKYDLASRIFKEDEVELSVEEISLIKERVGEVFPPLITGQIWKLLEV